MTHVANATIILRYPAGWLNPSIRSVARGLRNATDQSFKFEIYVMAPDLLTLIKRAKLATKFGRAAFLSSLLLRVPSETPLMRRTDDSDRSSEYPPHEFNVLIGNRRIFGSLLLIAKFAWRGNMRRGRILRRPCLCEEWSILSRTLCPVHQAGPLIKERASVRGFISSSFSVAKFNKELKRRMQECQFPLGGK